MPFKTLRNVITAVFLSVCVWSIIATSQANISLDAGTYIITSDCVHPTMEKTVVTQGDVIVSPVGTAFTDFGFPINTVDLQNNVSGTVGVVDRSCDLTYGSTTNGDEWIYSCFDNGAFSCTILVRTP